MGAMMKGLLRVGCAVAAFAAAPAVAADMPMPVKAPPTAAVVQSGGFYGWLDGSWQDIHLPRYNLGYLLQPTGGGASPAFSVDPEATGWGISGGFGWSMPTNLGTNDRFDIGGSFVHATDTRTGSAQSGAGGIGLALLDGTIATNVGCGAIICSGSGTLNTDYQSWQLSGRFATDYKAGAVILTPSLAVFGGHSHSNQTLSAQGFDDPTGIVVNDYTAQTALGWTDVGARAGLTATIPVTDSLSFGLGGTLGGAARDVSLAGNDLSFLNAGGAILFPTASAINLNASTAAFLANAEGSVTWTPATNWALRIFGGANFDNAVPGVAAPVITSGIFTGGGTTPTAAPASIKFEAETSFYAGGGVGVKF
jgi:hypothetical protein